MLRVFFYALAALRGCLLPFSEIRFFFWKNCPKEAKIRFFSHNVKNADAQAVRLKRRFMKRIKSVIAATLALTLTLGQQGVMAKNVAAGSSQEQLSQSASSGWVDPGIHIKSGSSSAVSFSGSSEPLLKSSPIPASYDLRATSGSTGVRTQKYGNCWAYAAMAASESDIVTGNLAAADKTDLSESHLTYYTLNMPSSAQPEGCEGDSVVTAQGVNYYDVGSNDLVAIATLSKRVGAADESVWKEGDVTDSSKAASVSSTGNDSYILQNADIIETKSKDLIKNEIMQYGAVTGVYGESSSNLSADNGYFNADSTTVPANHEVAIIGWDDSFEAAKLGTTAHPAGNGAWLCKNSWGEAWGDGGYFWLSYEDPVLIASNSASYQMIPASEASDNVYQYDGGVGLGYETETDAGYMANVFTSRGHEELSQVSFYTLDYGENYDVLIYKDVKDSPTDGTLVSETEGQMKFGGYHTISLYNNVSLNAGEKYSVIVELKAGTSGDSDVYLTYDKTSTFTSGNSTIYTSTSHSESGQSYLSTDGKTWTDEGASGNKNFKIKAFTDDISVKSFTVSTQPDKTTYATGGKFDPAGMKITVTYTDDTTAEIAYGTANASDFTFAPSVDTALAVTDTKVGITYGKILVDLPITVSDSAISSVSLSPAEFTYNGSIQAPTEVTVKDKDGNVLVSGTDYKATIPEDSVNAGSYEVKVEGIGTYTGNVTKTYVIAPKSIKDVKVGAISDQTYTGSAILPELSVNDGTSVLVKDTDYTVTGTNNTNVGEATLTISGKGNYGESAEVSFNIVGADLKSAAMTVASSSSVYTGSEIKPEVTVKLNDIELKSGTDYTLAYKDNINAGTASVTATGMGKYSGTVSGTFKITSADISKASVAVDSNTTAGANPKVTVTLGEKTLTEGTDYSLTIQKGTDTNEYTVTVTGKGNYTGTHTGTYLITVVSTITISAQPTKTSYKAGEKFDPTGLSIKVSGSGTDTIVSYEKYKKYFTFSPDLNTALNASNKAITVTFGGKSTTLPITVSAADTSSTSSTDSSASGSTSGSTSGTSSSTASGTSSTASAVSGTSSVSSSSGSTLTDSASSKSASSASENQTAGKVSTGDTQNYRVYIVLICAAAAVIVLVLTSKKKKKDDDEK